MRSLTAKDDITMALHKCSRFAFGEGVWYCTWYYDNSAASQADILFRLTMIQIGVPNWKEYPATFPVNVWMIMITDIGNVERNWGILHIS